MTNIQNTIQVYYKHIYTGRMTVAECLVYCTILSWWRDPDNLKNGRLGCTLAIFDFLNISKSQKTRLVSKLADAGYIRLNYRKRGARRMYIQVLVLPNDDAPRWFIKKADLSAAGDYKLWLVNRMIDIKIRRYACVNYDKIIKSGVFDVKTIRAKFVKIDLKAFRVDGRLYYTGRTIFKMMQERPSTPPDLDAYGTNDVYMICGRLGLKNPECIDVLRNLNSMGRIALQQTA